MEMAYRVVLPVLRLLDRMNDIRVVRRLVGELATILLGAAIVVAGQAMMILPLPLNFEGEVHAAFQFAAPTYAIAILAIALVAFLLRSEK